jgi:hypothetical protein
MLMTFQESHKHMHSNVFHFMSQLPPPVTLVFIFLVPTMAVAILLHLLFYFTYIQHFVLDNHSVELGTQDKEIVLQVA